MIEKRNCKVLEYVIENPGIRATHLAIELGIRINNIFMPLKKLEEIGLIKRGELGKPKNIFITEKGLEIFNHLKKIKGIWK